MPSDEYESMVAAKRAERQACETAMNQAYEAHCDAEGQRLAKEVNRLAKEEAIAWEAFRMGEAHGRRSALSTPPRPESGRVVVELTREEAEWLIERYAGASDERPLAIRNRAFAALAAAKGG